MTDFVLFVLAVLLLLDVQPPDSEYWDETMAVDQVPIVGE